MNGAKIGTALISPGLAPIVTASFTTRKVYKMKDDTYGVICIDTNDSMMRIGPFRFTDSLSDSYIKNKIRKVLFENECDYIRVDEVTEIVVIFATDDFDGMYYPKIEDVWPRDFGPKEYINRIRKKGGEK